MNNKYVWILISVLHASIYLTFLKQSNLVFLINFKLIIFSLIFANDSLRFMYIFDICAYISKIEFINGKFFLLPK